jgi:hypothetical protein
LKSEDEGALAVEEILVEFFRGALASFSPSMDKSRPFGVSADGVT